MSKRVFILYTGGTIGMGHSDPNDPRSPLVPRSWENLQEFMPAIQEDGFFRKEKGISIDYHSLDEIKDSSQFTTDDWICMAGEIEQRYDDYDGFIIIHGTDTMAYTASGLSFLFENLNKPVVLTGSQLPINDPRTDATNNLSNALHIAAADAFGLPVLNEVVICFNDRVLRGNRATKMSTNDFEGFESPNYNHLGDLEERIKIHTHRMLPNSEGAFKVHKQMNPNVMSIGLFPGLKPKQLRKLVEDEQIDGLVLKAFGNGNAPTNAEFVDLLKEARSSGTHILFITQCFHGGVHLSKYQSGKVFEELGVIEGGDMTDEAALAKMMYVLSKSTDSQEVRSQLLENLRGERNY